MKTAELRKAFLKYFKDHGHTIVPGSSLIPVNDRTLLFTNAGMVQFKEFFLGIKTPPYKTAASSQPCLRAGGKHNDLDNVGYTARHHTFFEMLGNFSFGDYFKREAIRYSWDFLTTVLKISPEKLWITVYETDDEAADIWLKEIKIDPNRFSRCGAKDNFWSMGDTGPCGPCTEIFYDHGPEIPGGPPGSAEAEADRYIEIWNLVFMQFNRAQDGTLTPLPKPSVDTGMGLERIAAVMQGVHSNYEIDIFQNLLKAIAVLTGTNKTNDTSMRVIADHIRSSSFLIADGVTPSNEGRGYVLRRIIRRAVRHGYKLGIQEPFFYKLVSPLVTEMGEAYPELAKNQKRIEQTLKQEEEQFAHTLDQGMKIFEQIVVKLTTNKIPGEAVFRLYDTYGFPPDLISDIARERKLELDYAGFEKEMAKQKQTSQQASKFEVDYNQQVPFEGETDFVGYESFTAKAKIMALFTKNQLVPCFNEGDRGAIILDRTSFYAEAGGQIGDKGLIISEHGTFHVYDTQKQGLLILHYGKIQSGKFCAGDDVTTEVDSSRQATMLNHSATHLLHAALRRILGEQVIQKGSLVAPDRLRFDFSHSSALTQEQIKALEALINQQIRANLLSHIEVMTPIEAQKKGAMALFGEKYGEKVRVLSMGEFSMELCGGTHAKRTGDIGIFKIISETGIASGIRRIEAVTGENALHWIDKLENQIDAAANLLKTNRDNLLSKLEHQTEQIKKLEKELDKLQQKDAANLIQKLINQKKEINGVQVIVEKIPDVDVKTLRTMVDQLKDKLQTAVIVLATVENNYVQIVVGVTKNLTSKISASELINHIAKQIGGKGGGRLDMAQGGGANVDKLEPAMQSIEKLIKEYDI